MSVITRDANNDIITITNFIKGIRIEDEAVVKDEVDFDTYRLRTPTEAINDTIYSFENKNLSSEDLKELERRIIRISCKNFPLNVGTIDERNENINEEIVPAMKHFSDWKDGYMFPTKEQQYAAESIARNITPFRIISGIGQKDRTVIEDFNYTYMISDPSILLEPVTSTDETVYAYGCFAAIMIDYEKNLAKYNQIVSGEKLISRAIDSFVMQALNNWKAEDRAVVHSMPRAIDMIIKQIGRRRVPLEVYWIKDFCTSLSRPKSNVYELNRNK